MRAIEILPFSQSVSRHRGGTRSVLAAARGTWFCKRARSDGAVLLLLFLVLFADPVRADSAKSADSGFDPSIGKVEVTLQLPRDKPYVGEMIMLRMRSFIRAFIVLDQIRQPALTNFDSQQLGRDKPVEAMVDGFRVQGLERDIAIFPQQSGRLIIEPFVRHVTISTDDNRRVQADFASKPVYVDVQNYTGIAGPNTWWLPVKSLTLTDKWAVPPDEIKPGTLSRRTITVEAVGMTADRLPPAPEMMAPGTIVFRGPARRETTVTEDGPVARAVYQWDIRPTSSSPAKLPAIHIRWFDTSERRMRDSAIADVWVAYVGTLVHTVHEKAKTWSQIYLAAGPIGVGVAGFTWTAAVAGLLLIGRRPRRDRARRRVLRRLRRAARFKDEPSFRAALADVARHDPTRWREISEHPLVAERLMCFDAVRYGRTIGKVPPMDGLATDIGRLFSVREEVEASANRMLPALDGPLPKGVNWRDRLRRRLA